MDNDINVLSKYTLNKDNFSKVISIKVFNNKRLARKSCGHLKLSHLHHICKSKEMKRKH